MIVDSRTDVEDKFLEAYYKIKNEPQDNETSLLSK